jgi:hypothetical protein
VTLDSEVIINLSDFGGFRNKRGFFKKYNSRDVKGMLKAGHDELNKLRWIVSNLDHYLRVGARHLEELPANIYLDEQDNQTKVLYCDYGSKQVINFEQKRTNAEKIAQRFFDKNKRKSLSGNPLDVRQFRKESSTTCTGNGYMASPDTSAFIKRATSHLAKSRVFNNQTTATNLGAYQPLVNSPLKTLFDAKKSVHIEGKAVPNNQNPSQDTRAILNRTTSEIGSIARANESKLGTSPKKFNFLKKSFHGKKGGISHLNSPLKSCKNAVSILGPKTKVSQDNGANRDRVTPDNVFGVSSKKEKVHDYSRGSG